MSSSAAVLAAATSAQVQQLRQQAELLNELQTTEAERLASLSDLRDEVYRLRLRRKRLQHQVQAAKARLSAPTLAQRLQLQHQQKTRETATPATLADTTAAIVGASQLRVLDQVSNAYRLTGKTLFPGLEDSVGLRLETFYGGKFYESYYIMVREQAQGKLVVFKHTLPPFVPVHRLAQQMINADLSSFIETVDDYLQAFVSRRQEALALEAMPGTNLTVAADPAFAYVQVTSPRHTIFLVYDDLCSSLPKRATVLRGHPLDSAGKTSSTHHVFSSTANKSSAATYTRLSTHEHIFLEHPLVQAYELFKDA